MNRILLLAGLLIIFSIKAFADHVDENTAKQVGLNFLKAKIHHQILKSTEITLSLVYKSSPDNGSTLKSTDQVTFYYVFNAGTDGFIIVAGDDNVIPVLGYSNEGAFDPDNIPQNARKWFEEYKNQIRYVIAHNIPATKEIQEEWDSYLTGAVNGMSESAAVNPLIQTKWDQSPYYNDLCPFDAQHGENVVTGCVATAMAQIMKFWNYPAKGSGFHSYNHPRYGTLSANFGSTTYQWGSMPNTISSSNNAIATLMYQCGVAVEMSYNVGSQGGSSAMTICSGYNDCTASAEDALKTYFGYKTTLQGLHKSDYTNANWTALLKTELDAGRPVIYAGRGDEGGHCFICDGYDNNNYFHFNWGWSGENDGYYTLTALNPGSGGAGGGSYAFTDAQRAIIGIEPENGGTSPTNYDLRLYSNLDMSATQIWFTNAFSLTVDIGNFGTGSFSGQVGAAIFDIDYNFIDFMAVETASIDNGYFNTITFSNPGSSTFVPGTYYVAVFYKTTEQDWTIVADGDYANVEDFEIYYSADIETNSVFTITTNDGKLIQGSSATVNIDILNTGSSTFYGDYHVNLSNLDGSWAQNIQTLSENNGLPSGYHYTGGNDFAGTITVAPGTYLLELAYLAQGSSTWYYAGSSNYTNPVYIIVEAPPIEADMYENNNAQLQSYNLSLSFIGNSTTSNTNSSNLHIGTDIDYYKIVLPSGYNYTIVPRLHDGYNSDNGQTYSVDALFSYSVNGTTYSETYDDVMSSDITVNNGGSVYFKVAPYFSGSTGTYLLDINITRTLSTDIENSETDALYVYPNPADEFVIVDLNEFSVKVNSVTILNSKGQQISSVNIDNVKTLQIPLAECSEGVYYIQIQSLQGILTKKIVISR